MEKFGGKLRLLRERRGLTVRELGKMLSVHNTYVSQMESGKKTPNVAMVTKIADIFGVTVDQLVRDSEDLP